MKVIILFLYGILIINITAFSFKLSSKWDRCFLEDLKGNSHPLFNYHVHGTEEINKDELRQVMTNIVLKFYYKKPNTITDEMDSFTNINIESIVKPKGKILINAIEDGIYKICITSFYPIRYRLTFSFTITSDISLIPSLKGKVMNENIKDMHNSLTGTIGSVENMINSQKFEINLEEEDEKLIENTANFLYIFTSIQIIFIVFIFIYQLIKWNKISDKEISRNN